MKINNWVTTGGVGRVIKSQGERPTALTIAETTLKSEMIHTSNILILSESW